MNPLNAVKATKDALYKIEELAGESQGLWDNAWTNAVVADHPDKTRWTRQTYNATQLHSDCMDVLRQLMKDLDEMAENNNSISTFNN